MLPQAAFVYHNAIANAVAGSCGIVRRRRDLEGSDGKKNRELEAENRELRQKLDDEYDRWKQTREQLDVCHVALAELMAEKQAAQRRNEDP